VDDERKMEGMTISHPAWVDARRRNNSENKSDDDPLPLFCTIAVRTLSSSRLDELQYNNNHAPILSGKKKFECWSFFGYTKMLKTTNKSSLSAVIQFFSHGTFTVATDVLFSFGLLAIV